MRELRLTRPQPLPAIAGTMLLVALAVGLLPSASGLLTGGLAAVGVVIAAVAMLPATWRALRRHRALVFVALLAALVLIWLIFGIATASTVGGGVQAWPIRSGTTISPNSYQYFLPSRAWPWRIGQIPLGLAALVAICAAGGFVLVADAVRVALGLAGAPRSGWRALSPSAPRGGRVALRVIPGIALVVVALLLSLGFVDGRINSGRVAVWLPRHHVSGGVLQAIAITALVSAAVVLVALPIVVGGLIRFDFDKEGHAREQERQRVAAHLHDSVLQTLALIQRQAEDPVAVAKLARRQEAALRAWMAGTAHLSRATISGAVRDMVEDVQDEQSIKVEVTVIGEAPLDRRGEELIAAAREALRNAARHAPGAPVNVFLDIGADGIELFVRDSGPGVDFEAVPPERRGLRDAVIGRMQMVGGGASVDSKPGEGTEIALRLPGSGSGR